MASLLVSTYSGLSFVSTGGAREIPLTTAAGNAIGYLLQEHIYVYRTDSFGQIQQRLFDGTDYNFNSAGTAVVLTETPPETTYIQIQRKTPMDANWVDYQSGNLLTAGQLNDFETWQLYVDQEIFDQVGALVAYLATLDGDIQGPAIKLINAIAPLAIEYEPSPQMPTLTIEQIKANGDLNALTSDNAVLSDLAADEAFAQAVGAVADAKKVGKLRIDDTGEIPLLFWWNGGSWVQMQTKGEQGPVGPAPPLADPSTLAITLPPTGEGGDTLADAIVDVQQDPETKELSFYFGVPAGVKGDKGDKGDQGDIGPDGGAPTLQDPPAVTNNVGNNPDGSVGDATVAVNENAQGDIQFVFGIPIGEQGPQGLQGDIGLTGPPPGLQSPAGTATTVPTNPDGTVGTPTVSVTQDGDMNIAFAFGVPQGIQGEKGDKGDQGEQGPVGAGVTYIGVIDATTAAEPVGPQPGDFYVNTGVGSSSWTGLTTVSENMRLIYNGGTSQWDGIPAVAGSFDLSYTAATDKGTVVNTGGSDAEIPVVGSNAGLMSPSQKSKLDGIAPGAQVNPDLGNYIQQGQNVSLLNNDANYLNRVDLAYSASTSKGTVTNTGGNNVDIPQVGSNAGLMTPTQKSKLDGIQSGAQVNPNLSNYIQRGNNNSLLTNDSGFITSGDLPSPPSVGNGTITIVQPGTSNQTFTVNQSGNKTITLKNDNTVVTPGNGQINVNASTGLSVSGSNATANQSGNTTRTLSLNTSYTDGRYLRLSGGINALSTLP